MTQAQILSDNAGSKRVLANLSLAIDEARLVRRIFNIEDNLRRIENLPEESGRVSYLRSEAAKLQIKLAETRLLAQSGSN
ncbi:MAG: hypothetical protein GY806_17060 [Gammaproteobacteria bacterium]|nr:hypothetical protein [Gammaproteobacteria bacterium]